MIHRPRGHARTRCLVWSQQSPLEFFQYGSGRPCARVSRVLTKATSYVIALSLQPKEVGNDNRAEVKNDGFGSDPVIRRCRLNVRFARKRKWLGDYEPYVHVRYLTCAQPGAHVPQPPSRDARRRTL